MPLPDSRNELFVLLASAADTTLKPWKHSIVDKNSLEEFVDFDSSDLMVAIECRSIDAKRSPEHDLDLEIYKSGNEYNINLSWSNRPDSPILWHGKHSVWMDSIVGSRCQKPIGGEKLESLARRLRALFISPNLD